MPAEVRVLACRDARSCVPRCSSCVQAGARTTTTGQCACSTTCRLTDPSTADLAAPRPREPTTSRSAYREASSSARRGILLGLVGGDVDVGILLGQAGQGLGDLELVLRGGGLPLLVGGEVAAYGARIPRVHDADAGAPFGGQREGQVQRGQGDLAAVDADRDPAAERRAVGPGLRVPDDRHRARRRGRDAGADRAEEGAGERPATPRPTTSRCAPVRESSSTSWVAAEGEVHLHLHPRLGGLHPRQGAVEGAAPDHPHLLAELGHPDAQTVLDVRRHDRVDDQQRAVLPGGVVGGPVEGQLAVRGDVVPDHHRAVGVIRRHALHARAPRRSAEDPTDLIPWDLRPPPNRPLGAQEHAPRGARTSTPRGARTHTSARKNTHLGTQERTPRHARTHTSAE